MTEPAKPSRLSKTIFVAIARFVAAASGLLIAVVLSKTLPTELEYATYRQTLLTFQFVAPLLGLGLTTAALFFLPREPRRAGTIVLEMVLLLFLAGGLFAAVMLLGGAQWVAYRFNNPNLETTLTWFSCYAIFALPVTLVGPVLVSREESLWVAGHSGAIGLLKIICVVGPVLLISKNSLLAVQGIMVWAILAFLGSLFVFWLKLPKLTSGPSAESLKRICGYGIPLSIATVIATINRNVDKILVSDILSPEEAAVFMNGAIEIPFIGIVVGSVTSILAAEFSAKFEKGQVNEIMIVWQNAVKKTAAILLPIGAFLYAFAEPTMIVLFDERYIASSEPFQIYLYLLPLRVFQGGLFLQMAGKTRLLLAFSIIVTIFNAVLTYLLVPPIGMNGAAYATVLSVGLIGFPLGVGMTQYALGIKIHEWIPYRVIFSFLLISVGLFLFLKFVLGYFDLSPIWNLGLAGAAVPVLSWTMLRWCGINLFPRKLRE
ncbi:MAG: oligosaccharide flippase family protein [Planctomycetota bacterium]